MNLSKLIKVASGEIAADTVLKGGTVVNVFTGETERADVAISDDRIAGIGVYRGVTEIDCTGRFIIPGLIDAHVHVESGMISPCEFARAVVARGTTGMIVDPHEIANVCGFDGVRYIIDQFKGLPINVKVMMPSCVPSTNFETAGAQLDADAVRLAMGDRDVFGLGEMMNAYGVVTADAEVLKKLEAAHAANKTIDGHAAGLDEKYLNAYAAAGIRTDHECTSVAEMRTQLKKGFWIQLRQGSAAKNVAVLVKGLRARDARRCVFCTDDKHADEIMRDGHIDCNLRVAVAAGMDAVDAVTAATLNAAQCYGLPSRGAVAPSYFADIAVVDDLKNFRVDEVFFEGKLVARRGESIFEMPQPSDIEVRNTVRVGELSEADFVLKSDSDRVKVIGLVKDNIFTVWKTATVSRGVDGDVRLENGLNKLAVIERHGKSGAIGLGLVTGYGLLGGAVAQTVAHDSHNLIVIGDSDADMAVAANALRECGGGLAVVRHGEKPEVLPLPIAGLMTALSAEDFSKQFAALISAARSLGIESGIEPFGSLSFLALPVIPSARVTDQGLFDAQNFQFVPIEA